MFGVVKATLADIKPGTFIGVGAMPQPDGSQKAIRVMIFAEVQRGTGEGHRPWMQPGSTMTNATVDTTVAGVDGQVLMVKYKDGEKKIVVPPGLADPALCRRRQERAQARRRHLDRAARRRSRTARSKPPASMSAATASCRN